MHLSDELLADPFHVHRTAIAQNFLSVPRILYSKIKHLIIWSGRQTLQQRKPVFQTNFEDAASWLIVEKILPNICQISPLVQMLGDIIRMTIKVNNT